MLLRVSTFAACTVALATICQASSGVFLSPYGHVAKLYNVGYIMRCEDCGGCDPAVDGLCVGFALGDPSKYMVSFEAMDANGNFQVDLVIGKFANCLGSAYDCVGKIIDFNNSGHPVCVSTSYSGGDSVWLVNPPSSIPALNAFGHYLKRCNGDPSDRLLYIR